MIEGSKVGESGYNLVMSPYSSMSHYPRTSMGVSHAFRGMLRQIFSDSGESGVSECLVESLPCHRQSLPLQPLLQDLATDPLWLPMTLVFNGVHSTAQLIIEEEDSECGVVCPNPLWNF